MSGGSGKSSNSPGVSSAALRYSGTPRREIVSVGMASKLVWNERSHAPEGGDSECNRECHSDEASR